MDDKNQKAQQLNIELSEEVGSGNLFKPWL